MLVGFGLVAWMLLGQLGTGRQRRVVAADLLAAEPSRARLRTGAHRARISGATGARSSGCSSRSERRTSVSARTRHAEPPPPVRCRPKACGSRRAASACVPRTPDSRSDRFRRRARAATWRSSARRAPANRRLSACCSDGIVPPKASCSSTASRSTSDRSTRLRRATAWVDPTVQIWNRSLLENLLYGSDNLDAVGPVLEMAASCRSSPSCRRVCHTARRRRRAAVGRRSAARPARARDASETPRLVVLDEPFLGLERDRRRALLAHARQRWEGEHAALRDTRCRRDARLRSRVRDGERAQLVEDGEPLHLAQTLSSRYRRLLQAQESVRAAWPQRRMEADSARVGPHRRRPSQGQ